MKRLENVPWDRDLHTEAKHRIYQRYFAAWFPILLNNGFKSVTYADGFSGPGTYTDGSLGSPRIALQAAVAAGLSPRRLAKVLLVDQEKRCVNLLHELLEADHGPLDQVDALHRRGLVLPAPTLGKCEAELPQLLDKYGSWGNPILAVLDTFGAAVSFDLIRRIAANPSSEVIVTMQPAFFQRFVDHPQGAKVFGPVTWKGVQNVPAKDKAAYLVEQYRQTFNEAGFQYVLDFELADEGGHLLYLVFGTNDKTGFKTMKDALWSVDRVRGIGYRDPRDPKQQTIDAVIDPQTGPLRRAFLTYLSELPERQTSIDVLGDHALFNTFYRREHTISAVRRLIDDRLVERVTASGRLGYGTTVKLADPRQAPPPKPFEQDSLPGL